MSGKQSLPPLKPISHSAKEPGKRGTAFRVLSSGSVAKSGAKRYPTTSRARKSTEKQLSSRAKKRPKKSAIEILIISSIAATAFAILFSLLFYFHPFSLTDVQNFASSVLTDAQEWSQKHIFSKKEPDDGNMEETASLSTAPTDSPAPIPLTTDLGDVADFTAEPVFPDQEDSIYSCFLDTAMGPMLYYNQGDLRWKSYLYGGSDPLSKYGCGPVCVAMIVNSFGNIGVTPIEMADWSAANGCFAAGGGSYHDLIPKSLSAFGLQVESVTDRTPENVARLLRTNHILVALMGKGTLTDNGHFIIIAQLTSSGNVYIADPANYENSTKEWDLQQLMDELKRSYDSGGPLWAVSFGPGDSA